MSPSCSAIICANDYMDVDVAYLLGMLFGRGRLIEERDTRRLIIDLDIRRKLPKLPPGVELDRELDLELENERSLNKVRRRINDLLDANVDIAPVRNNQTSLTAVFVKNTIGWRDIRTLCGEGKTDRSTFQLPDAFFGFPRTIHEEFLRGFADVAAMPSWADNEHNVRARLAFPVVHRNATFANQLVNVLQKMDVNAKLLTGAAKVRGNRKEHRIRFYPEEYESIGFSFEHKQILLKVLADFNRDAKSPRKSG